MLDIFNKRVLPAHNISLQLIHLKMGDQHLKPADPTIYADPVGPVPGMLTTQR